MGVLGVRTEHRYQTCRDEDCQRFACRVYREGYAAGHSAGHAAGDDPLVAAVRPEQRLPSLSDRDVG